MNKEATHLHIIETASKLFYEKGYNLTGINEVIAEAGIAKATLYSHFKSKEDLCLAYLEMRDERLLARLDTFISQRPVGKARLIAILEFLLPFFEQDDFNGCWCIRTVAEVEQGNDKILGKIKAQKNAFKAQIGKLVKENLPKLGGEEQEVLAKRIYLLYEVSVAESHLQKEAWPIQQSIQLLKFLLA